MQQRMSQWRRGVSLDSAWRGDEATGGLWGARCAEKLYHALMTAISAVAKRTRPDRRRFPQRGEPLFRKRQDIDWPARPKAGQFGQWQLVWFCCSFYFLCYYACFSGNVTSLSVDTISSSQSKEGILYSPQVSGSTLVSFAARYATS